MKPIYIEPKLIPATLRNGYSGKHFKAYVTESVTIPSDAGIWGGGSRDTYRAMKLETGESVPMVNHHAAPWDTSRQSLEFQLVPGVAVVQHSIFCGKDMGLTFYVHPSNAATLLPAPYQELTEHERIVLNATCSFKSSYNGMDRYEMAQRDYRWSNQSFPDRQEWDTAKSSLIAKGLLNKAGAVTVAGRNART